MSAKTTGGRSKAAKSDEGVLGSLPSTRPNRLGRHTRGTDSARAKPEVAKASAKPAAAKASAAKPRPKPAAARKPRPTAPAKPASTSKAAPMSAVPDAKPAAEPRPRAVRAGAHNLPKPGARPDETSNPSGTQLVGTVVQAAGELAQIGATVGGQIIKRALERIPRP